MIREDEQTTKARAEHARPATQAVHVLFHGPRFPDAPCPVLRAAGEPSSLDVDQEAGPVAVNDEVEALDTGIAEHRAARFIDGDVAETMPLQIRLEGRFVV